MRSLTAFFLAIAFVASAASNRTQLFNHKNLDGWKVIPRHAEPNSSAGADTVFAVKDGMLESLSNKGDIWYAREKIGNAKIHVVYKMSNAKGNSGIFIRIPVEPQSEDDAINKGIEVQIDNNDDDYHCTGVLYSMTQAKARPYKPVGEWNELEIVLDGQRTIVFVNGTLVTDYDGKSAVPEKKKTYEPDRGPRPDSGYIAVQNHDPNAVFTFKEVSMEPLTAKEKARIEKQLKP